jgi:hypothetical protein
MSKIQALRNKLPEYANYSDEAVAAAVWNRFYRDKLPFDEFSKRIEYKEGIIPRETPPAMPTPEQATAKGPGFLERAGRRVMENIQAVPILGGAAGAATRLARATPTSRLSQTLGTALEPLVPRTGGELARQTGVAAAAAPVGVAVGKAAPSIARAVGEVIPAEPVRGEAGQRRLTQALRTGLEPFGEIIGGGAAAKTAAATQRSLAQRPAGVPLERVQAARAQPEGSVPASVVMRGAEISPTQARFNREYNRLVGNPESQDFGRLQFIEAQNRLKGEYDRLLSGREVVFDDAFFNQIQSLLDRQRSLAQTGVMFAEARPIINTLSQIATLPTSLQRRINALRDIPPETADIGITRDALSVIDEAMNALRGQRITMDAQVYNELRSQLGDAAYRTADNARSRVLRDMQRAFDDAADRSLPREVVQDLQTTRNQYENFKILQEAQNKSAEPGLILPQTVGQVVRQRSPETSITSEKEMYELGRQGLSLGMRPSGPSDDIGLMDVLPTQIGGLRQKVGILERGVRGITEPIRAQAIMEGPRTEQELGRRLTQGAVRPLAQATERAVSELEMPDFEKQREIKEQQ